MLHLWVQMPSPWSKSRPTYHAIASFQVVETMKFPNPDLESRNPANPRLGQVWHYRFEAAMPAGDMDSSRPLHCFAQIWSFHQLLVKIHYFQKGVAFPGHWRHFPIIGRHFPVNPPAFPDHWPAFPGHWFFAILAVFPNFCKWCFRLQVRLAGSPNDRFCCCHPKKSMQWTTDIHTDWIFLSSGGNCTEMDWTVHQNPWSEKLNLPLWIKNCVSAFVCFSLPHAMLWGGFGLSAFAFQKPPTQRLWQKFWLKRKRWLERTLIYSFLEKHLQIS